MKFRLSATLVVFAAALWALQSAIVRTQSANANAAHEDYQGRPAVAREILVRVRPGVALTRLHALADAIDDRPVGSQGWHRIRSSSRLVQELVTRLKGHPDVLDLEPNYVLQATLVPNDPLFLNAWGVSNIHSPSAWDLTTGSAANVVGVVDTGVDYTHPDLAANIWSAPKQFTVQVGGPTGQPITCPAGSHGFNAITFTCDPMDDNIHGTHVSGTIGAVGNNGIGVVGVNWTTRIMGLKFLDSTGSGSVADAVDAIDFAIQTKAFFAANGGGANVRVLSNSWGGTGAASVLRDEIVAAGNADMLFVAAAGNAGTNNDTAPFYPAGYALANVVAVAATSSDDTLTGFSNYGVKTVHLAAPGLDITSTVPHNQYGGLSGTSMAAPHVSGAAMLVLAGCSLNTAQLKSALLNNVDTNASLSGLLITGGRLNVDRAVRSCATIPTVTLTSPANGAAFATGSNIALGANATDPDGISRVEFYQGATLIGTSNAAPFGGTWTNVPVGSYTLTAKAYDTVGAVGVSAPVSITVGNAGVPASASFIGSDTTTQGTWRGTYGVDGAIVVNDSTRLPAYATATTTAPNWTWAPSTSDVRALQKSVGTDRIAATWYNGASMTLDVNVIDGNAHRVSLYAVDWDNNGRSERLEIRDASNNALLDSRTISAFGSGQYLSWTVQGHVLINVVNVAGVNGVVSGVFFDSGSGNAAPVVAMAAPSEGASYTAPASIGLSATASDSDGINRVDFYQGSTLVATSVNGHGDGTLPYTATWSNVSAGNYTLTAKAYDASASALSTVSGPVHVTVTPAAGGSTSAVFVGTDTTTQGTWRGTYGTDGAIVVNDSSRPPAYASTATTAPNWTWTASTSDVRALQKNAGTDRVAATWYGYNMSVDVNIVDGAAHRVSLYLLDWDNGSRVERLEVRDASTNTLLDSRTISSFSGGQYVSWTIQGHITINAVLVSGTNAVISGVFFDSGSGIGNAPPVVTLMTPTEGAAFTAPASIALSATASDSDGINRVEFYQGSTLVATSMNGHGDGSVPYTATWTNVPAGNYTLTAKAYDSSGSALSTVSGPAHVTVAPAGGGSTSAVFVGTDASTQGTWRGTYGGDGAIVVNDSTRLPTYATATTSSANWTWAGSTADVRALQNGAGTGRIAATWYGYNMSIDVNIVDGASHRVSLYLVDWDNGGRVERVEVRDAATNVLLDSRTVNSFVGGQYLTWTIQGHVVINLAYVSGTNAVVSGVFFN